MRTSLLALTLLINTLNISAQTDSNKSIVLFTDDKPYLIPLIESTLLNFQEEGQQSPYFNRVTNLSRVLENLQDEQVADEVRGILAKNRFLSIDAEEQNSTARIELSRVLSSYNYFLKININPLVELIEYQFILYEVVYTNTTNEIDSSSFNRLSFDLEAPISNLSFFINPKELSYEKTIINNLKKLFPEVNSKPQITSLFSAKTPFENNVYRWVVTDTLITNPIIFDPDDDLEDLSVNLRVASFNNDTNELGEFKANQPGVFIGEKGKQKVLAFETQGYYRIKMNVSDPNANSADKFFDIFIYEKPLIFMPQKVFYVYDFLNNWTRGNEYTFKSEILGATYKEELLSYSVERVSSKRLSKQEAEFTQLLQNASTNFTSDYADQIIFPEVMTIDSSISSNNAKLTSTLTPFDAPTGGKYQFNIRGNYHGISSNAESINVFYLLHGSYLGLNTRFIIEGFNYVDISLSGFSGNSSIVPSGFENFESINRIKFGTVAVPEIELLFAEDQSDFSFGFGISLREVQMGYGESTKPVDIEGLNPGEELIFFRERGWANSFFPNIKATYRPFKSPGQNTGIFSKIILSVTPLLLKYDDFSVAARSSNGIIRPELIQIAEDFIAKEKSFFFPVSGTGLLSFDTFIPILRNLVVGRIGVGYGFAPGGSFPSISLGISTGSNF